MPRVDWCSGRARATARCATRASTCATTTASGATAPPTRHSHPTPGPARPGPSSVLSLSSRSLLLLSTRLLRRAFRRDATRRRVPSAALSVSAPVPKVCLFNTGQCSVVRKDMYALNPRILICHAEYEYNQLRESLAGGSLAIDSIRFDSIRIRFSSGSCFLYR